MNKNDKKKLLKILGYLEEIEKKASVTNDISQGINNFQEFIKKHNHNQRMNKIVRNANKIRLVDVSYTDKKGNPSRRTVEPYKLDGEDFWGYDIEKDSIRRFKTSRINGIKSNRTQFNPRWEIEMPD